MQQQLREKLERLHELAGIVWEGDGGEEVSAELAEMRDLTALMLAEPDRNCDFGTAEEQYKRFMDMCNSKDAIQCAACSMRGWHTLACTRDKCFARWAQMPYEAGCAK